MNMKKRSKLKSAAHYNHYKKFGWMAIIASRLNRLGADAAARRYLKSGKYVEHEVSAPYELMEGSGLWVVDICISSTVKKSRVKNIPTGCICVHVEMDD